jgi:endonuclease III
MELNDPFEIGHQLDHGQVKELFHSQGVIILVCNPGKDEKSMRYVNKETWKKIAQVPLVIRSFLCNLGEPPKPNLKVFQECIVEVGRLMASPVLLLSSQGAKGTSRTYRVVFAVHDKGFEGSLSKDQESAIAAWTVLCRQSRYHIEKTLEMESTHEHGRGMLAHTHTFSFKWKNSKGVTEDVLQVTKEDVVRYTNNPSQPHHVDKLASYPNVALVCDRPSPRPIADVRADIRNIQKSQEGVLLSAAEKDQLEHYMENAKNNAKLVDQWNRTIDIMKEIYERACQCTDSEPYRMHWLGVYTTKCSVDTCQPCGECRDCRTRMAQAAMVVFAAQGVSDKLCLARLGAVFRHPRYANFSLEEWCSIDLVELAACFKCCSKHCKNAFNCYHFLKEILENGPPTTLEDLVCFRSVQKKTACLWLVSVYDLTYGIPVDSHVKNKSVALGLVPNKARDKIGLISLMLQCWLDQSNWEMINNLIGGLSQFMETDAIASKVISEVVLNLSKAHVDVLKAFCNKKQSCSPLWRLKKHLEAKELETSCENATYSNARAHLTRRCKVDVTMSEAMSETVVAEVLGEVAPNHNDGGNKWYQTYLPGASIPTGDTRLPIDKEEDTKCKTGSTKKLFVPLVEARQLKLNDMFATVAVVEPASDESTQEKQHTSVTHPPTAIPVNVCEKGQPVSHPRQSNTNAALPGGTCAKARSLKSFSNKRSQTLASNAYSNQCPSSKKRKQPYQLNHADKPNTRKTIVKKKAQHRMEVFNQTTEGREVGGDLSDETTVEVGDNSVPGDDPGYHDEEETAGSDLSGIEEPCGNGGFGIQSSISDMSAMESSCEVDSVAWDDPGYQSDWDTSKACVVM